MTRTITGALAAACLLLTAGEAAAADPTGTWLTDGGKSRVEIAPCGDKLCGAIVWLKEPTNEDGSVKLDTKNKDEALRSRPIMGLDMLSGFVAKSAAKWGDGRIYNPEDGKTYRSKMELFGTDTLKVSGCVLFFCKTQTWERVAP